MNLKRTVSLEVVSILLFAFLTGCGETVKPYGTEHQVVFQGKKQVWAVAPAVNLSGQHEVDALLQADLLFQQLQEVRGLTIIPVNRVVEVYAGLRIEQVQSAEQARVVCDVLGCDALVVPTVTAYDPYDPPKFGGALQLFRKSDSQSKMPVIDPRGLSRAAVPTESPSLPADPDFVQAVGMFDSANGSVRQALWGYAHGRNDPVGPMGRREYLMSMDRYVAFAYHSLVGDLLRGSGRPKRA